MAFEKFFPLPDNKFGNGFVVQKYNGRWFIQEASKPTTGDGTIYKSWMSKYKKKEKGQFVNKEDGTPYIFPLGVEVTEVAAKAILATAQQGDVPF